MLAEDIIKKIRTGEAAAVDVPLGTVIEDNREPTEVTEGVSEVKEVHVLLSEADTKQEDTKQDESPEIKPDLEELQASVKQRNLPIFQNQEEKEAFEQMLKVDLSFVDHLFKVKMIKSSDYGYTFKSDINILALYLTGITSLANRYSSTGHMSSEFFLS